MGSRIRSARERQAIRQADLARLLKVTPTTVWRWESGKHNPTLIDLERIAKAIHVSVGWLVSGERAA
jgi:transcriptional regulator with XRE-family HTH domain